MFQSTAAAAAGTGFLLGNMNVWGTKQFIFSHTLNKNKTFFLFQVGLSSQNFVEEPNQTMSSSVMMATHGQGLSAQVTVTIWPNTGL